MTNDSQRMEQYNVVLPCEPKDFGRFISSILGRPQKIQRIFQEPFCVDRKNIINLYHLVEQRIHEQNAASLIQFTTNIEYNNNSSHEIDGFDGFIGYTEIVPLVSVRVTLSWNYVIKFKKSEVPEKQTIFISFSASEYLDFEGTRSQYNSSTVSISIEHTNRTWGADIESLLTGYVANTFKEVSPTRSFANKYSTEAGLLAGITLIAISIYGAAITTKILSADILKEFDQIKSEFSIGGSSMEKKVDFIVDHLSAGTWHIYSLNLGGFLLVSIILAILAGTYVNSKANGKLASHVLLTDKSYEYKTISDAEENRNWWKFWIGIGTTILTGLLSSFIFSLFAAP